MNKNEFTIEDYETIDNLIDEAIKNMDRMEMTRLTSLKNKIYRELVAKGLEKEVEEVIKKKWDIIELGIHNGNRRTCIKRKEV